MDGVNGFALNLGGEQNKENVLFFFGGGQMEQEGDGAAVTAWGCAGSCSYTALCCCIFSPLRVIPHTRRGPGATQQVRGRV